MRIGERVEVLEEVGSTNDYAKKLAEEGAQNGTVVWAKRQTAGKGTHGRSFISIEGNVFWSAIVRIGPEHFDIPFNRRLVYINALAVYNTIQKFIDDRASLSIKWPNDILLNEKKISGSLMESSIESSWIVVGVGINVVDSPSSDKSMIYPPTSLRECGYEAAREDIIGELNTQLSNEIRYFMDNGFSKLRDRYLERAFRLKKEISIGNRPDKRDYVKGIYVGIDDDGYLLLEREHKIEKFFSGTVNV